MMNEKFQESAASFQKVLNESMSWFREASHIATDTYSKQLELVSNLFNTNLQSFTTTVSGEVNDLFSGVMNEFKEITRKNMESVTNLSQVTLKNYTQFTQEAGNGTYSKAPIDALVDAYRKEAAQLEQVNKKFADSITKQLNSSSTVVSAELAAKLKQGFETTQASTQTAFQTLQEKFNKQTPPTAQAGLDLFQELNKELNRLATQNMKLWSDFVSVQKTATTKDTAASNGTEKKATDKKEKTTI